MYQGASLDFAAVIAAPFDAGVAVSTITVKAPDPNSVTDTGASNDGFTNVSGLVNIPCMDAPDNTGSSLSATENNLVSMIESQALRHVLLNGYYSQLSPQTNWGNIGWIAIVTNTVTGMVQTYDIRGAEADSHQSQTRLCLRTRTI